MSHPARNYLPWDYNSLASKVLAKSCDSHGKEFWLMRAYVVITAESGKAKDIAHSVTALEGVKMADAAGA